MVWWDNVKQTSPWGIRHTIEVKRREREGRQRTRDRQTTRGQPQATKTTTSSTTSHMWLPTRAECCRVRICPDSQSHRKAQGHIRAVFLAQLPAGTVYDSIGCEILGLHHVNICYMPCSYDLICL
ncbi:hypothetical protein J6590_020700 [Homalodisca vitripennis]|nr:hypothetical protein J6590_020700 [Homalodisca vitripennis]